MDCFSKISAYVSIFNIFSGIRGVCFNEGDQFIEGGVNGGGVIVEDNGFAVAAALDFTVSGVDKVRRFTADKGEKDYQEDDACFNRGVRYFNLTYSLYLYGLSFQRKLESRPLPLVVIFSHPSRPRIIHGLSRRFPPPLFGY